LQHFEYDMDRVLIVWTLGQCLEETRCIAQVQR